MAVRMDLSHTDIVLKQKKLSITKSDYIIFNVIDFCYISGFFKYKIPNKFIPCDFVAYFNTFSNLFRPGPNSWLPAVFGVDASIFLLDQVLEDADIFGFLSLDSKTLLPVIQQDAVEREEF